MTGEEFEALASTGMLPAHYARTKGDQVALYSKRGNRTFAEINARANQVVRALRRAGLKAGDGVAVICANTPEFVETFAAKQRGGFRWTPINTRLSAGEADYIVRNCEAKALFVHADLAAVAWPAGASPLLKARLAMGGQIEAYDSYEALIAAEDASDIDHPEPGDGMLYTSGTTGKPKGVIRKGAFVRPVVLRENLVVYEEGDANLLCGPGYHGAPLYWDIMFPQMHGAPIVMMEKFDAEEALRLIDKHRVTRTHMVSTMFHRLLALPEAVRRKYDLSSLKQVWHGAAPTSPETKRAMIDWFGPVLWEYFSSTEGHGNFVIGSDEWLTHPGSVGKYDPMFGARILDEAGGDCAPGEVGTIFFWNNPENRFEYFGDPKKTESAHSAARSGLPDHFTVGDMGYVDDDGYLFLTGRTAELIIAGGVNIYPQEIDDVLLQHPAVRDVCTVGAPNEEWGEEVRAVVSLHAGHEADAALADDIKAFARERLAAYKVPRGIDFDAEIPRSDAGKVQRKTVRDRYWAGRARSI
jgi:long-chain acyl-CoA synthetase